MEPTLFAPDSAYNYDVVPWVSVMLTGAILLPAILFAQAPDAATGRSAFEVASVKANTGGGRGAMIRPSPGGRFNAENVPAALLIRVAFNVKAYQISGAPSWTNSDRYDVTAKAEGNATLEEMRPMLQSMLADRFRLAFHRETKELPVYNLVAAKGGLKIVAAKEGGCITFDPKNPLAPPRPGETPPRVCGGVRMSRNSMEAYGISMTALSSDLSDLLGRTVIDKTGFAGTFDVHLEFAPDEAIAVGGQAAPPADPAGPSIFTALQEQLGLKVESSKGPVEVLVVDHMEKPSEN